MGLKNNFCLFSVFLNLMLFIIVIFYKSEKSNPWALTNPSESTNPWTSTKVLSEELDFKKIQNNRNTPQHCILIRLYSHNVGIMLKEIINSTLALPIAPAHSIDSEQEEMFHLEGGHSVKRLKLDGILRMVGGPVDLDPLNPCPFLMDAEGAGSAAPIPAADQKWFQAQNRKQLQVLREAVKAAAVLVKLKRQN